MNEPKQFATKQSLPDHLEWLAGMIPAYGDYAKEAAYYLRQYAKALLSETASTSEAERYRKGMENWKATAEQKDRDFDAHVAAMRDHIIEECAKVCDKWEAFTLNERNGKSGTAAMLANEIRSRKNAAPQETNCATGEGKGHADHRPEAPAVAAPLEGQHEGCNYLAASETALPSGMAMLMEQAGTRADAMKSLPSAELGPTPRTDAIEREIAELVPDRSQWFSWMAKHARDLERELAWCQKLIKDQGDALDKSAASATRSINDPAKG